MVDLEQKVIVKWNNANKKHYVSLGYYFTKIGDIFYVKAKDLPKSSSTKIVAKCDFCLENYFPTYKNYLKCEGKDCCQKCAKKKSRYTMIERYGQSHYSKTEEFKQRTKETCLKNYGVENPSQSSIIQEKKKQTNLNKFGTEWYTQSEQFKDKCVETYGVSNPMQSLLIQEKATQTLCRNGEVPVSKEEAKLGKLLWEIFGEDNIMASVPFHRFTMDYVLSINNNQIDIEYDGYYWHNSRKQYDRTRDEVLKSYGYKILRIVSKGHMPTKDQVIEAVEYLLQPQHDFTKIEIDL